MQSVSFAERLNARQLCRINRGLRYTGSVPVQGSHRRGKQVGGIRTPKSGLARLRPISRILLAWWLMFPAASAVGDTITEFARAGDIDAVREQLAAGADPDAFADDAPPLIAAIQAGHTGAAQFLIAEGVNVDATDAQGVPALHYAVVAGAADLVTALLDHGADPTASGRTGRAALDLAPAGSSISTLLQRARPRAADPAPVVEDRAPADADLARLVASAGDGDIIALGAGSYAGSFRVSGRTLTIAGHPDGGTLLTGGNQNMVAFVDGGGELILHDVTIAPEGNSALGLFIRGGSVSLNRCMLTGGTSGAIRVESGTAMLRGCTVSDVPNIALAVLSGASLEVDDTAFTDIDRSAIVAQDGGRITIRGGSFSRINGSAVNVHQTASLHASDAVISDCAQAAISADQCPVTRIARCSFDQLDQAIEITDGEVVIVHNNAIIAESRAIGIRTASTAHVTANRVRDSAVGVSLTGVHGSIRITHNRSIRTSEGAIQVTPSERPASLALRSNSFVEGGKSGILIQGADAVITSSGVTSSGGVGLTLQDGATARIADSLITAPTGSLNFSQSDPGATTVQGVVLDGPVLPTTHDLAFDPETKMYTAALLDRGVSDALRAAGTSIEQGDPSQAVDRLHSAWWRVREAASHVGAITVRVTDDLRRVATPPFEVRDGQRAFRGAPAVRPEDLRDPTGLLARLRHPNSSAERIIARSIPRAAWWRLALASDLDESLTRELAAELDSIVRGPSLDEELMLPAEPDFTEETLALLSERRRLVSRRPEAPELPLLDRRLNRLLLEEILAGYLVGGRALGHASGDDPWVFLPAGRYWVDVAGVPGASREVLIQSGVGSVVEVEHPDARWLTTRRSPARPAQAALVKLRPESERRAAARMFRHVQWLRPWRAAPRPDLTDAQRRTALNRARQWIQQPPEAIAGGQRRLAWAMRILSAHGEAADVTTLLALTRRIDHALAVDVLAVATHLESRLGRLGRGEVLALSRDGDPALAAIAGAMLHDAGLIESPAALLAYVEQGEDRGLAARLAPVLFDSADRATATVMRRLALGNEPALAAPALAHVLAWGGEDDQRGIAEKEITPEMAFYLAPLVADPTPFLQMVAWADLDRAAALTSVLHTFDSAQQAPLRVAMTRAVRRIARREPERFFPPDVFLNPRYSARHFMNGASDLLEAATSFREPGYAIAANVYAGNDGLVPSLATIPRPKRETEWLDRFVAGAMHLDDVLDWIPHERLRSELEGHAASADVPDLDLFLACHQVTTRAGLVERDAFPDGVERRGYLLEHRALEGGAISGVLDVRPRWEPGQLLIDLRLRQVSHYEGTLISDTNPASWAHHRYVRDNGRALLSEVRLISHGRATQLESTGEASDGWWRYSAPWNATDLRGVLVDVRLRFFETDHHLAVDLSSSGAARELRRLDSRIDALAQAGPDPDQSLDLATLLLSRGHVDEAMDGFQRLLLACQDDAQTVSTVVRSLSGAGRHQQAVEILQSVLARVPARGDLWMQLGHQQCAMGEYGAAGATFDTAAAHPSASAVTAAWWAAGAAWCAGDADGAHMRLRLIPRDVHRPRTLTFRYALAIIGGSAHAEALRELIRGEAHELVDEKERALLDIITGEAALDDVDHAHWSDAELCRARWHAACHALAGQNRSEAIRHLREAVTGDADHVLELHLARTLLRQLEGSS